MTQCSGKTQAGDQCRAEAQEGAEYCWRHVPAEEGVLDEGEAPEMSDRMMTVFGLMMAGALIYFGIRKMK